jgi:hypothetical protein
MPVGQAADKGGCDLLGLATLHRRGRSEPMHHAVRDNQKRGHRTYV